MTSVEKCSVYEEMRNRNVERNKNMMRMLGLLPSRSDAEQELQALTKSRTSKKCHERVQQRRRSLRIATSLKSLYPASPCSGSLKPRTQETNMSIETKGKCMMSNKSITDVAPSADEEVRERCDDTNQDDIFDGYSTDISLDSMYAVEVNIGHERREVVADTVFDEQKKTEVGQKMSASSSSDPSHAQLAALFGNQFQEMVFRALMQSTKALSGLPTPMDPSADCVSTGIVPLTTDASDPPKTWSERTYNIVKARRRRETPMTRTSAGEGSDSQKDLPIPENENPQQRALRTRRLNRLRKKRANDLMNNRKAFKKCPYVLHVDGLGKPRGIHKHVWRAALRGVCGRLDPTMDNINHHPKHVIDSLWQSLQKEWEFEGFSHRAREMFERSATKFMRNRKMQLKYKCQKIVDDSKPHDVNGRHWKKIVEATKKVSPVISAVQLDVSNSKGKEQVMVQAEDDINMHGSQLERHDFYKPEVLGSEPCGSEAAVTMAEDVDARIRSLQCELMRLQKSREFEVDRCGSRSRGGLEDASSFLTLAGVLHENVAAPGLLRFSNFQLGFQEVDEDTSGVLQDNSRLLANSFEDKDFGATKENVQPQHENILVLQRSSSNDRGKEKAGDRGQVIAKEKGKSLANEEDNDGRTIVPKQSVMVVQESEMDCGDVVRVFAYTGGIKEEIGKAIVMGLAGSKFAKKVIPNAWRSIKFTYWTEIGASKICPFPPGWVEQLKSKTVKEVNGKMILWPDMLLQPLGGV